MIDANDYTDADYNSVKRRADFIMLPLVGDIPRARADLDQMWWMYGIQQTGERSAMHLAARWLTEFDRQDRVWLIISACGEAR